MAGIYNVGCMQTKYNIMSCVVNMNKICWYVIVRLLKLCMTGRCNTACDRLSGKIFFTFFSMEQGNSNYITYFNTFTK